MKNQSTSQKIRVLIERGYSNKYIVDKLKCNPRTVYNIRYRVNKELGIAALGKPAPKRVPKAVPVDEPTVTWTGVVEDGVVTRMVSEAVEGTGIKEPDGIVFVGPEPFNWRDALPLILFAIAAVVVVAVAMGVK